MDDDDRIDRKAEIAKRRDAIRFAVANTEIEGLSVSSEAMAIFERWANLEIDDDEMMNTVLPRWTR